MKASTFRIRLAALVVAATAVCGFAARIEAEGQEPREKIESAESAYPGGMPFGLKMYTDGLTVVGFSDVDTSDGSRTPAFDAGIHEGDVITEINGEAIRSSEDFVGAVEKSADEVEIKLRRGDEEMTVRVKPSKSERDGKYKTGMWLRDSTAGIGTVTFILPESGEFAGLGHGVCDADSGHLVELSRGVVCGVDICGVKRGSAGSPGELRGYFSEPNTGVILKNTEHGVFGYLKRPPEDDGIMELGHRCDVCEGDAGILCTIDGNGVREYSIEITKTDILENPASFEIRVTDNDLIAATGGIVQGMSGSPIIQNGKLVGAVTHVMVSDPLRGYGIYVESMKAAA